MCSGCLDLVDRVLAPIPSHAAGVRDHRLRCDHVPVCTFRGLRPSERDRWMREALPITYTMLCLKEGG